MKRYLLFSGYYYYPEGGWEDFRGSFDTIEEAMYFLLEKKGTGDGYWYKDWFQVVDLHEEKEVYIDFAYFRDKYNERLL